MISLVIPFYVDEERLKETILKIVKKSETFPIKEVLFVHNGKFKCKTETVERIRNAGFQFLHVDTEGIGAAYKEGFSKASCEWVLLSASDLPFDFSDIDSFIKSDLSADIYIGSKGHPESEVSRRNIIRHSMSVVFYLLRIVVFGFGQPKDTQGTLFLRRLPLTEIVGRVQFQDYFFSFALIQKALNSGIKVDELAIKYYSSEFKSNIPKVKTSLSFIKNLIKLRFLD